MSLVLWRRLHHVARRQLYLLCAVHFLIALLPLVLLWIWTLLLDSALSAKASHGPMTIDIWILIGLEGIVAVAIQALQSCGRLLASQASQRFASTATLDAIVSATHLELIRLSGGDERAVLEKIRQGGFDATDVASLAVLAQECVASVLLIAVLVLYAPYAAVAVALSMSVVLVLGARRYINLREDRPTLRRARRRLSYLRRLAFGRMAAKETRAFGLGQYLADQYNRKTGEIAQLVRQSTSRALLTKGISDIIATVGFCAAYGAILRDFVLGNTTVSGMAVAARALWRYRAAVARVMDCLRTIEPALAAVELDSTSRHVLASSKTDRDTPTSVSPRANSMVVPCEVEFDCVSFRYPGATSDALTNITFRIAAGESVGLIGKPGAGKSTLVGLLAGLYRPNKGKILLGGRDLRAFTQDDRENSIRILFQDFARYRLTVRDNILLGDAHESTDPDLARALYLSGAERIVRRLPDGLNQRVGPGQGDGADRLTPGDWQHIALARALRRPGSLLVLDEPTSLMRRSEESSVLARLRPGLAGVTLLVAAKRRSVLNLATRILFLDGGRVIADGRLADIESRGLLSPPHGQGRSVQAVDGVYSS